MSNINQYPNESLTFEDDDFYDIDFFNGTGYETKKILGSTIKAGILAGIVFENLYLNDGILAGDRIVTGNSKVLTFRALAYMEQIAGTVTNPIPAGKGVFNYLATEEGDYLARWQNTIASRDRLRILHDGRIEINEQYKLPNGDGLPNQVIQTDGAGNASWQPIKIGNYAQTVQGATINTTGEQSIVGSGVGSLSIPANAFLIGDSFHGKIGGLINATGGGGRSEVVINIKAGATILATTGVFDLDTATNQGWECELDFTIATLGATGSICTNGNFCYTKDNNRTVFGFIFQDVQPLDTTVSNTLDITIEWSVLNVGDDIYSANFVLYKVY